MIFLLDIESMPRGSLWEAEFTTRGLFSPRSYSKKNKKYRYGHKFFPAKYSLQLRVILTTLSYMKHVP